jgi:hypothetical protein
MVRVGAMTTDRFGFIAIPAAFEHLMGVPDAGTRMHRAEGDHAAMRRWCDGLCRHIGPCVSPGGAAVYAGVSRAGVYKRMKAGGLTAFCFHIVGKKKTLFGGEKKLKQLPLVYIPVAECKAWGLELEERARRLNANRGTPEDEEALGEADPGIDNPDPSFVHYDPKDRRRRSVRYVDTVPEPEDITNGE